MVAAAAVGGVADDRMVGVLHVAAQLVAAAGDRLQFHQGVARTGVALDRVRQLDRGQAPEAGEGALGFCDFQAAAVVVVLARQGMVDRAGFGRPAAHDGNIGLMHGTGFELDAETARGFGIEGEQQQAGGAAVEAMHGLDAAADLVAQQLHREARFVAVQVAAMHQQAGRLVDGDQVFVAI